MDIVTAVIYLLLGAASGLLGGLLGMGGGIIIVPALYIIFGAQLFHSQIIMHLAICTSLATIIVTSLRAILVHHQQGAINWPVVIALLPGILLGAVAGALLVDHLSSDTLRISFGIFELLVALQIATIKNHKPYTTQLPNRVLITVAGTGIGTLSALLGIGGGSLTMPLLLWCNVALRQAIAISAACGLPIAISGTLAMICAGWNNPALPIHTVGYLYWPAALLIAVATFFFAPLGARLTHSLPLSFLRYSLAGVLAFIGLRMLI